MNNITPKEVIANLNHIYGMVAPDIQRSLDVAIKALERPQDDINEQTYKDAYEQGYADGWKERYGEPDGRPKGKWIDHPNERGSNWEYSMYECSECHTWQDDDSNYCGNCGADMKGVRNND